MADKSKDVKSNPAGLNDDIEVVATDINSIIEKGKDTLKTGNGVTVRTAKSTDLSEGMSIKAYDGGKPKADIEVEK